MAQARRKAQLLAQFKHATKERSDWLKFAMDESDYGTWYVQLSGFSGDNGEFEGGEYLVRVILPIGFPATEPPQFYFLTPNGLYGVETKVCISIGEWHKDSYRAVLGVIGFCDQLVSGLIGWKTMGGGIEILSTTAKEKAKLAAASRKYNADNNAEILDKISASYADYSAKWAKNNTNDST